MNQEIIDEGIKKLNSAGLNIFASIKVSQLPSEILLTFEKQSIAFSLDDTLWIIAHGGKTLWSQLSEISKQSKDPIDTFSINKMQWFGKTILNDNIKILYPNNALNIPLQQIGRITNISRSSPLGIDISPSFGLWFAFRGVFLTKNSFSLPIFEDFKSPCETCVLKPCILACPANAISINETFKISNCTNNRKETNSKCKDKCLSRKACPYKIEHQYDEDQMLYHATNSLLQLV